MKKIVILQPMFFPWVGYFEQVRLCDVFVHLDDVQMPMGRSFESRVQIKTPQGSKWLTAPIKRYGKQLIREVSFDNSQVWREKHLKTLRHNYSRSPFFLQMVGLAESVYSSDTEKLADFNIMSCEIISKYLGLNRCFIRSSDIVSTGVASAKLLSIIKQLGGDVYITGHGARNYLDHELFEKNGIKVEYMDYRRIPYRQLCGDFDPYVTTLDLIANTGKNGIRCICSGTKYWREFLGG